MSKVRYGIIGFGGFAERSIAPAIQASPNSELIAIQKRSLVAAEEKAKVYSIPMAFATVEEITSCSDIDAVYIVSANAAHCKETLTAARHGKHVLVEKPMAMNVHEAASMIEACSKAGVKLMVGHMLRLSPLSVRMKALIDSGTIGTVTYARADFMYNASVSQRLWVKNQEVAGGGPVFDIGVHCLDTLKFILNDEVTGTKAFLSPIPADGRTEDTASITLQFSRGAVGAIYCSYATSFRRTFMEIVGTAGTLSAFDFTHNNAVVTLTLTTGKDGKKARTETEEIEIPNLHVTQVTAFSSSILNRTESPIPGEIGLSNQKVLDAAIKGA